MMDKYEEKLQAEIKKLEAETKQINSKWYKKLNYDIILKSSIFVASIISAVFLTNLYDIKNERLKLERAELKHDIRIFTLDKDSLYNEIQSLSKLIDKFSDSLSGLFIAKNLVDKELNLKKSELSDKNVLVENLLIEIKKT